MVSTPINKSNPIDCSLFQIPISIAVSPRSRSPRPPSPPPSTPPALSSEPATPERVEDFDPKMLQKWHENHHFGVNLGEFHQKKLKWHGDFGWIAGLKTENIELKMLVKNRNILIWAVLDLRLCWANDGPFGYVGSQARVHVGWFGGFQHRATKKKIVNHFLLGLPTLPRRKVK